MGGSASASKSKSSNYIDRNQLPFLQDVWSGAQQLQQQQGQNQQLQGQLGGLFQQGQQMQSGLQNNQFLGQYNPASDPTYQNQMAAGQQAIGQAGDRAMHGAGQQGVMAGQFGSGGNGVANGIIGENMQNAAGQLSGQLSASGQQNQLGQAGLYAQSQLGGLNALQGQAGIAGGQAMAPWLGMQNYAGLVGGPAIVGNSDSKSGGMSGGIGGGKGG
jgi:hypothetical protein